MTDKKYLINKSYLLTKFDGKGGWTYISIPEIKPNKKNNFGWVIISGFVDDVEITRQKLMPTGKGILFLAKNAKLRKVLKKESGDTVVLKLYIDNVPLELTEEIRLCFENEKKEVFDNFNKLDNKKQQSWLDYIYKSKTDRLKADRIVEMILELQ